MSVVQRRSSTCVVAVIAGLAVSSSIAGAANVTGVVSKGPVTPVCREGTRCDAPAAGFVLVFTRPGLEVRTTTQRDGHFALGLRPGVYTVRSARRLGLGTLRPATVKVAAGRPTVLRLFLDTGIRTPSPQGPAP